METVQIRSIKLYSMLSSVIGILSKFGTSHCDPFLQIISPYKNLSNFLIFVERSNTSLILSVIVVRIRRKGSKTRRSSIS